MTWRLGGDLVVFLFSFWFLLGFCRKLSFFLVLCARMFWMFHVLFSCPPSLYCIFYLFIFYYKQCLGLHNLSSSLFVFTPLNRGCFLPQVQFPVHYLLSGIHKAFWHVKNQLTILPGGKLFSFLKRFICGKGG